MQPPSLHTRKKDKEDSTMVHYFHSDIAQKYGINAAVLAAFIWECIEGKSITRTLPFISRSYTKARFGFAARCRC